MSSDDRPWWRDRPPEDHRPPPARGRGSRRQFGSTWWGAAWVDALEYRAGLNTGRLSRGRSYARRGAVSDLRIAPGVILATVQGSRPFPYSVTVRVSTFSDADWSRVFEVIGAQLGRTAALLDGELPPEIVGDASAAGLELLPTVGDVVPRCSCPDPVEPCKHSAAVCYLVAETFDQDPFALLLLRGRSRDRVLAALRSGRMSSAGAATDEPADEPGIRATVAYAREHEARPDVPAPPLPPTRPGQPVALTVDPPPDAGIDAAGIRSLAADAVLRAWQLATEDGDSGLRLSVDEDLARRAAPLAGTPDLAELADRVDLTIRELTGWALAWRHGGADGLRVLREAWRPGPDDLDEGWTAIEESATGRAKAIVEEDNWLTIGRRQLRLGTDGRWYPFLRSFGGWDLAGPPSPDPREALTHL